MALDPDVQTVLDLIKASGRPAFETLSAIEAREFYAAGRNILQPDPPEIAEARDLTAPGRAGGIPLRLYRGMGTDPTATLPCLVYFHGGGWVLGDRDTHDGVCRNIANHAACRVLSVDYRLAPEHKFPAAVDDSAAAVRFAFDCAAEFGLDRDRIAVGGDSAGGNLAAVVALMARDGALPRVCYQLLIYPAVDLAMTSDAYKRITDGFPLTTSSMAWFREHYLRDAKDQLDWRASPLRAASLAGVAPAFVLTASHDPLSDEGEAYARRLEQEGVRVVRLHFADQMHGFLTMGRFIRASDTALLIVSAAIRRAWASS